MKKESNIGHLVTVKNNDTGKTEFIFLYITGREPTEVYKKVVNGIRKLRLPSKLKPVASIQAESVTDFSRVELDYPKTIGCKIHGLPVVSFFDSGKKAFKEKLFLSGVRNIIEKDATFFPDNRLPAVVTGSDFFDREDIIKKIWKHVEQGQNILLCGPRRYGKTSIMREVEDRAVEYGFRPVMIDLESVFTAEEFVARVSVEVQWSGKSETEKNKKAEEMEEELKDRWIEEGKRIFGKISKKKKKLLFLLDECPYMLDSFLSKDFPESKEKDKKFREKTEQFIKWFREQRDLSKNRCVFVITGSINPKTYLKDNELDKDSFADCKEVRVTFFDSEAVRIYIESLLLGQEIFLHDELINELVKLTTPGIPYFIQIVMNHVVALYRKNPQFSIEDLRKTYDVEITGFEGRRLFDTFERHFKRYGSRQLGATALLRELSNSGDKGIEKTKLEKAYRVSSDLRGRSEFDIILRYLEYDFYIEKVTGTNRYRFASPILRDYWQKNQR